MKPTAIRVAVYACVNWMCNKLKIRNGFRGTFQFVYYNELAKILLGSAFTFNFQNNLFSNFIKLRVKLFDVQNRCWVEFINESLLLTFWKLGGLLMAIRCENCVHCPMSSYGLNLKHFALHGFLMDQSQTICTNFRSAKSKSKDTLPIEGITIETCQKCQWHLKTQFF